MRRITKAIICAGIMYFAAATTNAQLRSVAFTFDDLPITGRAENIEIAKDVQALTDEAYSLPEATSRRGLSWLHRWMLAKGLEMKEEPPAPAWIAEGFE